MELKAFIHGLPAFERFQSRHLDMLVNALEVRAFDSGDQIITEGELGGAMYIVMSGTVMITLQDTGADSDELPEAQEGELIGLLSLVENMPASATCTAKGRVLAAALTPDRFLTLFLVAPGIAHQLQYMIAVQLARSLQQKNHALRKGLAMRKPPKSFIERLLGSSG